MYKVKVQNTCSCFLKSGLSDMSEFNTKEDAQKEAEYMIGIMRNNFCAKHEFEIKEQFGDFTIYVKPRAK